MRLTSLAVNNYRNLRDTSLSFGGESIGIVGENGQGKTNLLESIYLLSVGSTWRGESESDLIRFNEVFCRVEGVTGGNESVSLGALVEKQEESARVKKKYLVNDISRKKETFTSYMPIVLFHPEDIQIVNGSPSSRRGLLDECIGEVFPYYRKVVSQYSRVVTARNRILDQIREGNAQERQLEYWTESMVRLGCEIYLYRFRFFSYISLRLDRFAVVYSPHIVCEFSDDESILKANLEKAYWDRINLGKHKEIMSAMSQYGPHKDDYAFSLDSRDIGRFGSRGEQRAALFSFKKAHVQYIEDIRNMKPILLLDDIFSEFDAKHRNEIASLCVGYQTFVTGTEENFFKEEEFKFDQLIRVKSGNVQIL
jgi:DNA replication and repair protein RecF